jgi:GTP diphosphokinase / guanosine-3',5'-bis(diphosphate) 3'-diphosphatase
MMRQYELTERVLSYNPNADEGLLNKAYVYAMKAHAGVKRNNGDPYFSHPLEVAAILTDLKLDDATIATALLHDVVEDTGVTKQQIDQTFGAEIGGLVDGLTKIMRLDLVSRQAQQAESFRKLLIAISSDVRVLLVKLADRLHNMRTLQHNSPGSRRRNAEETLEIYAPLAGRMGMQSFREELEDLSFKWLYPEAYATLQTKLTELRARNAGTVEEIGPLLSARLVEAGIKAEVSGREKKPYAIWRKMQNKQISLEQLSDIYGFRIIVDSTDTCYRTLGVAHSNWRSVPGRFKDYISTPKQNNYQSLHTTIVGPRSQRVEMQIRTRAMHNVAELGIAAHALYKDRLEAAGLADSLAPADTNGQSAPAKENPYRWLRHMVGTLLEGSNPEEFLEHTKLELFHDQVFCFTPRGRIIALPRGATPIDFAYGVHTDVGNRCVGAIVNGRPLPLTTQLRNGDEVEILTAKDNTPPVAWEQIAVTGRARSSIRRANREAERQKLLELGRRLLVAGAAQVNAPYDDEQLRGALAGLGYKSVDDVAVAVGSAKLPALDVVRAMFPALVIPTVGTADMRPKSRYTLAGGEEGWFGLAKGFGLKFRMPGAVLDVAPRAAAGPSVIGNGAAALGIPLRGLRNDINVTVEDGGAIPGDRVVGVLDGTGGVRIFQIHSPRLQDFEAARWIDVTWDVDPEKPERFPARLSVTVVNAPGSLAKVATVIGEADGNIDSLRMVRRAPDFTEMMIDLEVYDIAHLNAILAGLRAQVVVSATERVFGTADPR